jgi:hypothetical protein
MLMKASNPSPTTKQGLEKLIITYKIHHTIIYTELDTVDSP